MSELEKKLDDMVALNTRSRELLASALKTASLGSFHDAHKIDALLNHIETQDKLLSTLIVLAQAHHKFISGLGK